MASAIQRSPGECHNDYVVTEGMGSELEPQKPFRMALWQRVLFTLGLLIALGGLVWEIAHGDGRAGNEPPKLVVAVILGGFLLVGIGFLPLVRKYIRMWRRV